MLTPFLRFPQNGVKWLGREQICHVVGLSLTRGRIPNRWRHFYSDPGITAMSGKNHRCLGRLADYRPAPLSVLFWSIQKPALPLPPILY